MKNRKNSSIIKIVGIIAFFVISAKVYYELKWYDLLLGILKIQLGKKPIALVSQKTLMFVAKKEEAEESLKKAMALNGWTFVDRFGMGYIFSNEDEELLLKRRDFNFGYVVFEIYPRENYRKAFKI